APWGETWAGINVALREGLRSLPARDGQCMTLTRLLYARRGVRNANRPPPLTIPQVLTWADRHRQRTGDWPHEDSGPVADAQGENWLAISSALRAGLRGLAGAPDSLARLLTEQRGARNVKRPPPLTIRQILEWADEHYRRTRRWPTAKSGSLPGAPGETWLGIQSALQVGMRGLPLGSSLARLLLKHRQVRRNRYKPRLSLRQILAWADEHHRRSGEWPRCHSGAIANSFGESWITINSALHGGHRGLLGGSSLAQLLEKHRGVRNQNFPPPLTTTQVLKWADAYHQATGRWPTQKSGPVRGAAAENWQKLDTALNVGRRGLPGGSSLARLLEEFRGRHHRLHAPRLTRRQILIWADAHHRRTGRWPTAEAGAVIDAPAEKWLNINAALRTGGRGLKTQRKPFTLAKLLEEKRGVRNHNYPPPLSIPLILRWAEAHQRRTGSWPNSKSGPIRESPPDTWAMINGALYKGRRGLPGGSSLHRLTREFASAAV
ncbi:MAG TPA: hypothetical protein VGM03_10520, partial [Phycisphaerae bacterium]